MNQEIFYLLDDDQQQKIREAIYAKFEASIESMELKVKPIDMSKLVRGEIVHQIQSEGIPDEARDIVQKHITRVVKEALK